MTTPTKKPNSKNIKEQVKDAFLTIMDELKIKYGSCKLTVNKEGKKEPIFTNGWESPFNKNLNGVFYKTGKDSNISVLDFDDITTPTCIKLKAMADKCCNFIIQTKKGYHYYFILDPRLKKRRLMKLLGFDYLSNKSIVFCPPTKYKDLNGTLREYKLIDAPKDNKINAMSEELIDELLHLFIEKGKPDDKFYDKVIKKEINKVIKKQIQHDKLSNEEMKLLLQKINLDRSTYYNYWILVGLALKNDGFDFELWDEFSKRSKEKYQEGETYYLWNHHLQPHTITTRTLIMWFQEDNNNEYKKMLTSQKINNYDVVIDLTNENEYNDNKMIKLLESDIEQLGEYDYMNNISITKSFKYFNNFHMHIRDNNTFYRIDIDGKRNYLSYISDMNASYAHLKVGEKEKPFINMWKSSSKRQMYNKFDFMPNMKCSSNIFNTFTGFVYDSEIKEYDITKIQPILDHIKHVCIKQEYADYIIKYFAHIRQKPNKKTLVCVVLYSDTHGVGKNTVIDPFIKIFKGYESKIREEDINAKFNKILENKLFAYGDEIKGSNKHDADNIKNLITQTEINIEPKGKDSYKIKDMTNYALTTNHSNSIKIEDTDRRFFIVECNDEVKSEAYFDNLYDNYINNDEVIAELDKYLSTYDLTGFKPKNMPITKQKQQMALYNLHAHIKLIQESPEMFCGHNENGKAKVFTTKEIIIKAKEYAKNNRISYSHTEDKISKDLSKYFGDFKIKRNGKMIYKFPNNLTDIVDDIIKAKYEGKEYIPITNEKSEQESEYEQESELDANIAVDHIKPDQNMFIEDKYDIKNEVGTEFFSTKRPTKVVIEKSSKIPKKNQFDNLL